MHLLDCNDASLRLWRDGQDTFLMGIAWFNEGRYQFGQTAWRQARRAPREINNRYWHRLSTQPLSPALGPARHTADLVHAHLETLLADVSGELVLVIPGAMEPAQLSLLLGIIGTLPVTPCAVVHRSALIGTGLAETCVHVELHLHQASITPVQVDNGMATAGETQLLPGFGLLGLMDDLAEIIGQQFVSQTRFDPQRRADTEQALYEQIPALLQALATQSEVSCVVEGHTARVSADALRAVGQRFSAALAPLIPADISLVAFDSLLSSLPGLSLSSQQGQPLRTLPVSPDAILAGANHLSSNGGELVFQRRVACAGVSPAAAAAPQVAVNEAQGVTHFLIAGRALAMTPGTTLAPGVSVTGAKTITVTPGTEAQVNGHGVNGDVTLAADDRLTVADIEVRFITVES
ncbi:MAG: hypothetical protein VW686_07925 [Luminiphilus sp.]